MLLDQFVRRRSLLLGTTLIAALLSCKSASTSGTKFSWDEDLAPVDKPAAPAPAAPGALPTVATLPDASYCAGSEPATCLTLVMRIPTKDLLSDFGLSTLALAAQSKDMLTRLDEACAAAWEHYQDTYRADGLHPLRQKLIAKVQKMRGGFVFMTSEYLKEDLKLNPAEIAISSRLTKFDLVGKNTAVAAGSLNLAVASTVIETDIRSVFVYSGTGVAKGTGNWDVVKAFTYKPVAVTRPIDRDISWSFDPPSCKAQLDKLADPAALAAQGPLIKSWVEQARSMATAAMSGTLKPSFGLVGMGFSAYKSICSENAERCSVSRTSASKTEAIGTDMADMIPSSEVNEAFRMAIIKTVEGILDKVLETADKAQITNTFDLN